MGEEAGEVIDPVQGEGRENGIERVWRIGERLFRFENVSGELDFLVEWEVDVAVEESGRGLGGREVGDPSGERW